MADERKVAFNWYLNRQGPRGPQGVKGDTGFSPNITVETDTLNEYILRITNEGGYFLTSNLREHKEDRGGTYIRYDRDNGVMYAGEADTATDAKAGMIKIATTEDVEAEDESTAVTPAILADYVAKLGGAEIDDTIVSTAKVWSSEKTSQSIAAVSNQVATNTTDISNIKTALPNKQNKLIAGDNITIVGDTISSTTGGDVTLAGDNSFTGKNTFNGETTFKGRTSSLEQEIVNLSVISNATLKNAYVTGTLSSLGELTAVSISTAGIKNNQNNKYYLNQASITAGDNITVEETNEGVKISSASGTPESMVTTNTDQTITGLKTFSQALYVGSDTYLGDKTLNLKNLSIDGSDTRDINIFTEQPLNLVARGLNYRVAGSSGGYPILHTGNLDNYVDGTTITFTNNKLTAVGGSSYTLPSATATTLGGVIIGDGLTVLENGTLSAQVTGTQIEALQRLINDLSTKIDNLTGRVAALEEQIDGGVA